MVSNPRSNEPIHKTPFKGKGRLKETPKKNRGFKRTPKKLKMYIQNMSLIARGITKKI